MYELCRPIVRRDVDTLASERKGWCLGWGLKVTVGRTLLPGHRIGISRWQPDISVPQPNLTSKDVISDIACPFLALHRLWWQDSSPYNTIGLSTVLCEDVVLYADRRLY